MVKKIVSVFLSSVMLITFCFFSPLVSNAASAEVLEGGEQLALENEFLALYVSPESGEVKIADKSKNTYWLSNPADAAEDKVAKNIFKTNLKSQLLIEYLEQGQLRETNSFVSSVNENGLTVQKSGEKVLLNFYFPEQKFNIPLFFTLDSNRMIVTIDYGNISEKGNCQLTKISVLPYFAAGSSKDNGYTLVPDGSGAVINFNNGKYSQGSYKMNIYGKDQTEVSEKYSTDSKPCLLPVFGISHSGKGSVMAVASAGEAGASIYSCVSGKETSYNNTFFEFSFRYYNTATLLDRTWASKEIIMTSPSAVPCEKAEVQYTFSEKEDIINFAEEYRQYLIDAGLEKRNGSKNTLFLDIYMGVKVKKQFLGFPYSAIEPLTDFEQLSEIIEELDKSGVENISAKLTGADSSGAYYGKIDDKVNFSSAVGGKKGYESITQNSSAKLYPYIDITEFTDNSLWYNSFFHSAVSVINKTVKLYDYKFSTKLRDYDAPVRYLLKPEKVEKAVNKLCKNIEKSDIKGVSFDTLANRLYSSYSGKVYEINETKELFAGLIEKASSVTGLLLSAPNAYAIPYAEAIINLPVASSGHYTEDFSVPFVQMVLDGYVEYATEPVNLFGNKSDVFLSAVESNSSLQFVNMYETFDKVADTNLHGLYSATYDYWKDDIKDMYRQLLKIREYTEQSSISGYKIITDDVREITFENGAVIYINRSGVLYDHNGIKIPAENCYILEA